MWFGWEAKCGVAEVWKTEDRRIRMLPQETIRQLQGIPAVERLQLIEILLNSLKRDITHSQRQEKPPANKRFTVRSYNLGQEVLVDRDAIHSERTL